MLVVDASVLVAALVEDGERARQVQSTLLEGSPLAAPELVDLEVASALRRLCRAGVVGEVRARHALDDLARLRMARVPHRALVDRCWELRENLTTYDAVYVAAAEALGAVLLTADARLAGSPGIRCDVEVVA